MPLNRDHNPSVIAIQQARAQLYQSARVLREANNPDIADAMELYADVLLRHVEPESPKAKAAVELWVQAATPKPAARKPKATPPRSIPQTPADAADTATPATA